MSTLQVTSHRRYCLLKRLAARREERTAIESLWQAKQEAEPGDSLPVDFPFRDRLIAAGYVAVQDLDGANAAELEDACFTARESEIIFAALAPLIAA